MKHINLDIIVEALACDAKMGSAPDQLRFGADNYMIGGGSRVYCYGFYGGFMSAARMYERELYVAKTDAEHFKKELELLKGK